MDLNHRRVNYQNKKSNIGSKKIMSKIGHQTNELIDVPKNRLHAMSSGIGS